MLYDKLFDYQQHILDSFYHKDAFGLFLDMGLGKTILSLAFAERNNCTKVLVITINGKAEESVNIKDSWLGWGSQSSIQYTLHSKYSKNSFLQSSNDFFVINYESLFSRKKDRKSKVVLKERISEFIRSCKNHNVAIIIDESHKMKNLQSLQTTAIFQIQKLLKLHANKVYTYLLTGTPFTTGYIDLYSQLKLLGYSETKGTFIDNYCVRGNIPGLLGWQQPIVGYKNIDDLFNLIHKFAITIKSEDVIKLPEQVFINHTLPLSRQFELYCKEKEKSNIVVEELRIRHADTSEYHDKNALVNNPFFRNIAYPDLKWIGETTGTAWLRARQLSIGFQGNSDEYKVFDDSRFKAIESFLERNVDNYIVFYNYSAELFELFSICEKLNYKIDVYCGEVKSLTFYNEYCDLSESEQLTDKGRVILANFASGSTGKNWQKYNKVIITSIPLYKDYAQAVKRVHRTGQKQTVIYHIFYQQNWLDYSMKHALDECKDYSLEMFESDLQRVQEITQKTIQ